MQMSELFGFRCEKYLARWTHKKTIGPAGLRGNPKSLLVGTGNPTRERGFRPWLTRLARRSPRERVGLPS